MLRSFAFFLLTSSALAAGPASLTALPTPLETRNPPVEWKAIAPDAITMRAGPKTDWFVPPWNPADASDRAPTLLFQPKGDFVFQAKVSLHPKARFDSGALTLFIDKDNWAKLCLEAARGDDKLQVVMVVNRGISDDSYTDVTARDDALYLRIIRRGPTIQFEASPDGIAWTMYRTFALNGDLGKLKAGLLAQSPTGEGVTVEFSELHYGPAN